jgi:hypothetical protein
MSNAVFMRGATPVGNVSLCRSCRHAHVQLGYADSEIEVRCGFHYENPRVVPFAVRECTDYTSKIVPTMYEMEKMALVIDVRRVRAGAGFGAGSVTIHKPEDEEE